VTAKDNGEAIDSLHAECVLAVQEIRTRFAVAREQAARWEPRPLPKP
jgi:hypothetical protein